MAARLTGVANRLPRETVIYLVWRPTTLRRESHGLSFPNLSCGTSVRAFKS